MAKSGAGLIRNEICQTGLIDIVNGSTLLASGGGGSIKTAYSFIQKIVETNKKIIAIPPDQLSPNSLGVVIGAMGSPISFEEYGLNGAESRAIDVVLNATGEKGFDFIVPVETGSNIFVAILAACNNKTTENAVIVNGDGAGRAVPTLSCLKFNDAVEVTPYAVLNSSTDKNRQGDIVLDLPQQDSAKARKEHAQIIEDLVRNIISTPNSFNSIAAISGWVMDQEQTQKALVPNTISISLELGDALNAVDSSDSPIPALEQHFDGMKKGYFQKYSFSNEPVTYVGPIQDSSEPEDTGFDFMKLEFKTKSGKTLIIINQNENMLIWDEELDHPITICPDSICMVGKLESKYIDNIRDLYLKDLPSDIESYALDSLKGWHGLSSDDISKGQELYLFSLSSSDYMREKNGEVFSKLAKELGYFGKYIPVSELSK